MFVHPGSHVDAPSHLYPHKKTLDQYPIYRFILHATVVEIKQSKEIILEHVKNIKIKKSQPTV
jgi:kynurenine formamidase